MVEKNKVISKRIDNLAQELDTLLSNRKGRPHNKSTLSLLGFVENREGGNLKQSAHISADLRLPKLEKKWQLRFSSYDREDEFEGNRRNRDGAGPRAEKYGTSVGFLKKIGKVQTLFRPRIELKNPLVTSFLLRLEKKIKLGSGDINWIKKFFAHSIDGVGQSIAIDYNKTINKSMIFQFFNEAQYFDKDNLFKVSQGPSIRVRLSDSMAASGTLGFNSQNRTVEDQNLLLRGRAGSYHLNSYQATISFSHKLLNRVFHYQISPFLDFSKNNSFKGNAGITLRTEIIF